MTDHSNQVAWTGFIGAITSCVVALASLLAGIFTHNIIFLIAFFCCIVFGLSWSIGCTIQAHHIHRTNRAASNNRPEA